MILLLALYRNQEFARVGYYVFTEYDDPELRENPPVKVDFEKVKPFLNYFILLICYLLFSYKS